MIAWRRGRGRVGPPGSVQSRRSEAGAFGAPWASARRPRRRVHRKSSIPKPEVARTGATESPIHSPPPLEQQSHQLTTPTRPSNLGEATMQQTRARQILQSLIQGIDPVTREELPRETVLQHADVLRALLAGLSALEQTAARAQRRAQLPDNVGRAWTTEEEGRLVSAFKTGDLGFPRFSRHRDKVA
jgi:predicted component of type VI protein secretion system